LITDYASLQAAVASSVHRVGDTQFTAELPRFVQMAEMDIFRNLQIRQTESMVTGTTSGAMIVIPIGMDAIERLSISAYGRDFSLDYTSPNGLEYLSFPNLSSRYTIENGAIRLLAPPAGNYTYTLYIVPNMAPLSVANPTNWLILNAPDVYLYGTLLQAAAWTKDGEESARCAPFYAQAIESVRNQDAQRRFPLSGGLQIKPREAR